MSAYIRVEHWGLDIRCDTCVYQNGLPLIPCDNGVICNQKIGYTKGKVSPNFPVPSVVGPVVYVCDYNRKGLFSFSVIVTDCDERADPRLVLEYYPASNTIVSDYPHDSPNYR